MRDHLKYVNYLGETVDFGQDNIVIDENDFRDYKWTYSKQYGKVVNFEKGITTKKLPITIFGDNCTEVKNTVFELLEKDVLAEKKGKMYVGDYFIEGYFFASDKSNYTNNYSAEFKLQFVTDKSYWIKENPYVYRLNDEATDTRGLGYAYDYPYDFLSTINTQNLNNPSFVATNFRLTIYGPVTNPTVHIGANTYTVNVVVSKNEYIVIDSLNKTIKRTTAKGVIISEFSNRSLENYIFQKIVPGNNVVSTVPKCNIDITIIEERSEPKWI